MVSALHDTELEKRQRETFLRFDDPREYLSKNSSWAVQQIFVTKSPEFMPQQFKIKEQSSYFLFDRGDKKNWTWEIIYSSFDLFA